MKKLFKSPKAFTLIELLVVIAVLGVLAAGVLIAIDPVDKINSANDAKAQTDVATLANAAEAYAVSNNNFYPGDSITAAAASTYAGTTVELVAAGELKIAPAPPTAAYTYTIWSAVVTVTPISTTTCIAGRGGSIATCKAVVITSTLNSKKYTGKGFQRYESSTGKTCQVASATTVCP